MPSILPDDFFTCCTKCLSCGLVLFLFVNEMSQFVFSSNCRAKCTLTAKHQQEDIPHRCPEQCFYNKELDNEILKCLQCHRNGHDTVVHGKLTAASDTVVKGIIKYMWSGFVIECPFHGEIYRSRQFWYGNNEPKDKTHTEITHVWPGDSNSRRTSDITPRKVVELLRSAGRFVQ